jgi:hypothetical protein
MSSSTTLDTAREWYAIGAQRVQSETRPRVREERVRLVERDVRQPNEPFDVDWRSGVRSRHRNY